MCVQVCTSEPSKLVWPINSPTAALSLNLLITRSSLALLGRGYLIRFLDCRNLVQAGHLAWCLSCNYIVMSSFTYTKGYSSKLVMWDFNSTFISQSVCLLVARVSTLEWLLNPLSFPSTCIHSQTKDDSVLVFVSTTRAALLSEQMCILLFIRFLVRRSSAYLRSHSEVKPRPTVEILGYLRYYSDE